MLHQSRPDGVFWVINVSGIINEKVYIVSQDATCLFQLYISIQNKSSQNPVAYNQQLFYYFFQFYNLAWITDVISSTCVSKLELLPSLWTLD